jgi:hypothetical protein
MPYIISSIGTAFRLEKMSEVVRFEVFTAVTMKNAGF